MTLAIYFDNIVKINISFWKKNYIEFVMHFLINYLLCILLLIDVNQLTKNLWQLTTLLMVLMFPANRNIV